MAVEGNGLGKRGSDACGGGIGANKRIISLSDLNVLSKSANVRLEMGK